jgi:benzoate/toluate 1,2-dioxygenase reductase subunit
MSSAKEVSLRFRDGVTTSVSVSAGQSVLDAALAAGVPLMHQCRSGSCSSCEAKLVDGTAHMRAGASSTLLRSEFEAGERLLCLTHAESDCTFDLSYASDAGAASAVKAHAFIDDIERLAPNVVRLTLELADGDWLDFKPGQFLQVRVPGVGVTRSYSPASTPAELPKLELIVRLLADGAMSTWLEHQAKPGDVLELEGPFGSFFLREEIRAPHILVAGGTGLAPIMSMLDTICRYSSRRPPVLLSFGCANPDALFCLDELEARRHWLPRLSTRISVDRGATGDLLQGTPVQALLDDDANHEDTVAYLCGPPSMIDAARRRLESIGLRRDNIFAEQFTPSS